jgi:alkylation response protein AidB-like acyl-CoA dehydrogenase
MEFELPTEVKVLRSEAEEVAIRAARRSDFPEDSWLVGYDEEFTAELGEMGWIGMTWPVAEGGHGRTPLERFVVYEQLIKHGAPIAAGWIADRQIGPTLLQFGQIDQRRKWLPGIVAGRSTWCIGLSEPDAGSDVASLRTRAVASGDTWIVNGSKIWTSGAAAADWCYLIARTDLEAPKHAGLSEFVVDMKSPGIRVTKIKDMTGNEHFCQVMFEDVRVPAENLVGTRNQSFKQVMRQMEHERGGIDRLLSNYALYRDLMADEARIDRTKPLARLEIARIESLYQICRLMVLRETLGQAPPGFSAVTKIAATELEVEVANFCASQQGAAATLWGASCGLGGRSARAVCYAPAYTIMGGTVEVLRNTLAERVLHLPRGY